MKDPTRELLKDYYYALYDAQSMWLSEYCCSSKERNDRETEDREAMKDYIDNLRYLDETFIEEIFIPWNMYDEIQIGRSADELEREDGFWY